MFAEFTDPNGFSQYGLPHIFMLILIAAACLIVSIFYARAYKRYCLSHADPASGRPVRHPAALTIGLFILATDVFHYTYLTCTGQMNLYMLPLHLCGMSIYVVAIHCLYPSDFTGQMLYALFLPGASCALLFPDWGNLAFFSYLSMRCFIVHGLVVLYIIMQTAAGVIRPRLSAIWKPVVFLAVIAPGIIALNHRILSNYMYLSLPAIGSPLEFLYTLANGSGALYLFYFGILALLGMTIMYLPFTIYRIIKKYRSGKAGSAGN